MGWPSYYEDIEERRHDGQIARGAYGDKFKHRPVILATAPPLQPRMHPVSAGATAKPDAETIARRTRELREKHTLALLELLPGTRWRH